MWDKPDPIHSPLPSPEHLALKSKEMKNIASKLDVLVRSYGENRHNIVGLKIKEDGGGIAIFNNGLFNSKSDVF